MPRELHISQDANKYLTTPSHVHMQTEIPGAANAFFWSGHSDLTYPDLGLNEMYLKQQYIWGFAKANKLSYQAATRFLERNRLNSLNILPSVLVSESMMID
jgi:hypothetical protein